MKNKRCSPPTKTKQPYISIFTRLHNIDEINNFIKIKKPLGMRNNAEIVRYLIYKEARITPSITTTQATQFVEA
jgi:hypothetical protein